MKPWKEYLLPFFYVILVLVFSELIYLIAESANNSSPLHLIIDSEEYHEKSGISIGEQFIYRAYAQPFNIISLLIFICAITHIFLCHKFHLISERWREENRARGLEYPDTFGVEFMGFMGEIELVFGLWIIPLMVAMSFFFDWSTAINYLNGLDYTEPLFVIVIMALASTRPIMHLSESIVRAVAQTGGGTVKAWWLSILTFGPILGSFITEPAAMTISALLLAKQFYHYEPTPKFAYATLGLLFVNISVGGVMTNFAAPPVLMVVQAWHWDTAFMMTHFGLKAILGILISNALYFWYFNGEFQSLEDKRNLAPKQENEKRPIPFGISLIHVVFLAWIVVHLHYPVVFMGTFLLFLGFYQATRIYQDILVLRGPVLVGFFLAGLIAHGNLQGWWVSALLANASDELLMVLSVILTAFNDNAEVTFLATLIPSFDDSMKYAVVAGAIAGGGLTVIANAPNLAGQSLLNRHFQSGISALYLFYGAAIPTAIMALCFYLTKVN